MQLRAAQRCFWAPAVRPAASLFTGGTNRRQRILTMI